MMRSPIAAFVCFLLSLGPLSVAQQPAQPPAAAPPKVSTGTLNLSNASLTEVIDVLCRTVKINCIVDPRVKGAVTLNTYGETKDIDARSLLDMLLRINGFTMVQVGEFHRIVPLADAARLPVRAHTDGQSAIPEDDQLMLNLVFLKYASVNEVGKLIEPFIGEGAKTFSYAPANLLFLLDSRRNIRRTMEIIALFDNDTLAHSRVRLFELKNGTPSAIAKEMDTVLKAISMADREVVKFLPIDRINTLIAIAPNAGAFEEVEKWIQKLDTEVKVTAGSTDTYVYRVKYSRAEMLAMVIMQLFGGVGYGMGMGMMGGSGGGYGGYGGMGGGYGGYGGMGGMGGMGGYCGGYGGGGYGGYPQMGTAFPGAGSYGFFPGIQSGGFMPQYPMSGGPVGTPGAPGTATTTPGAAGAAPGDLTGGYMGYGSNYGGYMRIPRIIPNPMDNTLMIQATPQEYQQIVKLLKEVDIPPRQVLIDAKIYEVTLTGAFASGVSAFLQKRGGTAGPATGGLGNLLTAQLNNGAVGLTTGMFVGASRELLAFLQLSENASRTKVLSSPSVIATDNLAASINVGTDVPTLSSQAVSPVQVAGSSVFANTISTRSTGVNLAITARINPSGIVTLLINQEVSAPQAPPAGSIQSPSFSKRSVQTQVTVQDGDTIAIGGIINESSGMSTSGIPFLHKLPVVGSAFGSRSYSRDRSELIIFMTPRVIYDTNQITEASDELRSRLRKLAKVVKE